MKLINDWKRVTAISLSFWMQIAGLLVLIVPEVRYMITGQDYNPFVSWWLGILFLLAGLFGRIFQQGSSKWREWLRILSVAVIAILLAFLLASKVHAAPVSERATLDIAVPFIAQEEGERRTAYLDIVGVPTICFGSTRGVRLGMTMTHRQCLDLLRAEVAEYREGLHRYFTAATINNRLTPHRDTAYTSLAFNAGIRGIGRSTATRRLNAGNIVGGCEALRWWNKAGGRVIRGLVNRRQREYDLCMIGI
jgi:GH24 family phage-related lysozyme (muramidase)